MKRVKQMIWILLIAGCAVLIAAVVVAKRGCGLGKCPPDESDGAAEDSANETIVVIDVRSQEEYDSGHLAGALLIPYDAIGGEIEKVVPERTTPIRLYCHSGGRAETARRKLVGMGYADVKNLGGFAAAAEKLHKDIVK